MMALNEALTYLAVDLSEVHVTRFTSQTTCRLQHLCLLPPHYPGVSFSPTVATKEKSTLHRRIFIGLWCDWRFNLM